MPKKKCIIDDIGLVTQVDITCPYCDTECSYNYESHTDEPFDEELIGDRMNKFAEQDKIK